MIYLFSFQLNPIMPTNGNATHDGLSPDQTISSTATSPYGEPVGGHINYI